MKILNRKSIILISVGLVCALILLLTGEKAKLNTEPETSYEEMIENKLVELISGLGGVSNVRVMVVQSCGAEKVYAVDTELSGDRESAKYYSAGDEESLLIKEIAPVIKGVAVVCDSEGKNSAKAKIIELVSSVLDIPANDIFVDT